MRRGFDRRALMVGLLLLTGGLILALNACTARPESVAVPASAPSPTPARAVLPSRTVSPELTPIPEPSPTPSPWPTPSLSAIPRETRIPCTVEALAGAVAAGGRVILPAGCAFILSGDLPPITADLEILGNRAVIDGGGQHAALSAGSAWVSIRVENLTIQNTYHPEHSPAIHTLDGSITVIDSLLTDNRSGGNGGALGSSAGNLNIVSSHFYRNSSQLSGGALSAGRGLFSLLDSSLVENQSAGCGGALFVQGGSLSIERSALIDNRVSVHGAGAVCLVGGAELRAVNSTFSGNSSSRGGGAIAGSDRPRLQFLACTLTGNQGGRGGAIWTDGDLTLGQSIVWDNHAAEGEDIQVEFEGGGSFFSLGYNLIGVPGELVLLDTDLSGGPAGLAPLEGGLHPLLPGSPALDAVPPEFCPVTEDQLGRPRPGGVFCDIGAAEMPGD